tara:strand:- start:63 stop:932 length:870 start_codon:yes stop_codon:yes gene_type:complete
MGSFFFYNKNIMTRSTIITAYFVLVGFLYGCGTSEEAKGPVIQPKKEATWVRTEKVKTTKEEVFSGKKKKLAKIPINISLEKKISLEKMNTTEVTDKASCLDQLNSLDRRRTVVQKAGGMWSAFERNVDTKPYSFNGMQLDSNTNKMIFGLRHLCQTAEGVPLNSVAIEFKKLIKDHGSKETKKILISRGEHLQDIDKFLNYAEVAHKLNNRKIGFNLISPLFGRAKILIELYEEISKRIINEKSIDVFLSDSVTLLKVMTDFIHLDQVMSMALNEDAQVPYRHIDQDM